MATDMDPDHPILPNARLYEVVALRYDRTGSEPILELTLRHTETSETKRLLFQSPTDIHVGPEIQAYAYGLAISDLRNRQLEGIGVRVYNFEDFEGGLRFFARDVVDISNVS